MYVELARCDVLILAPLDLEISSLNEIFNKNGWEESTDFNLEHLPFPNVIELEYGSISAHKRLAVIIQLPGQGILNAGAETAKALQFYEPSCVVSFGIAGGLETDVNIGDVIFASQLIYYEPAKFKKIKNRSVVQSRMIEIDVEIDPWLIIFQKLAQATENCAMHSGPFASGEKLFADGDALEKERIGITNDKVLGVDMEAAGVGRVVNGQGTPFFLIKGISDLCDADKNKIPSELQKKNRCLAAYNAAEVLAKMLVHIQAEFPVHSGRGNRHYEALERAEKTIEALEPHGIHGKTGELYRVIYGRRSRVPAYYHWIQYGPDLSWIDFKILCAINELPRDVFEPVPLVTVKYNTRPSTWRETVESMLGSAVVTNSEIKSQLDDLNPISSVRGLSPSIYSKITELIGNERDHKIADNTLMWILYMIGQKKSSRIALFTWEKTSSKWDNLIWACDALFAVLKWGTFELGIHQKKNEEPLKAICIDRNMTALQKWLDTNPPLEILKDFVCHFKNCNTNPELQTPIDVSNANQAVNQLQEYWKSKYFS